MTVATRPRVALEPLVVAQPDGVSRGGHLAPALREAYGGDLWIPLRADRPTVIANFVSTIDGVVSFQTQGQAGGGEVSGFFEPDRFVMGLLRAVSDAVLIGAGTLRDTRKHVWSPAHVHPSSSGLYEALRADLDLAPSPTTVVVTGKGDIDLGQTGLSDPDIPVLIVTTDRGVDALLAQAPLPDHIKLASTGSTRVQPAALISILRERRFELVLTEGGPHLFGQLVQARLIDELFLTIAPQLAGRAPNTPRLALVEGTPFTVASAPWSELVDLRKSGNHLFARYRFKETVS